MISRDGALTSLWQATTSRAPESYNGNRIAAADKFFDVIIVGGGITGVSTAILLRQAGFKCAILEAHTLCFGTTGGTTAHLNTILDTPYPAMIKNFDRQTAQTVADATRAAIGLIRSNIEKFDIACGFQKTTGYLFSQTDEQTKELEEIYETSRGLGIELGYTDSIPVDIKMIKALAIQDQARFHPTRYVHGLAEAFQIMDGRIIEQCRVTGVENNDPVTVHTSGGDIQCTYLIYATHIPPGMNILDTRCAPYRSYAIAATLKGGYPEGLIYDMYDPYHYYRTQTIDDQPYLIVGGEDHKTGHGDNIQTCFEKLESHIREHFPVDTIGHKWSSQFFESVDGLPYIGHLPGQPGNILVATGFGGNGMIYSGIAALLFKEMLLKEPEKLAPVFNPNRIKPIAGFTNFVRENADVVKKWAGKLLPADRLASFSDMARGEGRIVKLEGETLALYKDERGELHAIAPTCTHMGCHVTWNNMEKSWDCPCHGARYSPDGAVLTGPADRSLEIIDIQSLVEGGCI
ncbi:MAG TPA: FAD-dependent oxidoreductase [Puia sp.]|jgi:glycine/D-amino acid oxidase-like deaminating enzyme/nitrite reductase/ring-hydroxylating ferredoxin subunit|nr:FAD-dependent oxidoreductase [Puia sp.]